MGFEHIVFCSQIVFVLYQCKYMIFVDDPRRPRRISSVSAQRLQLPFMQSRRADKEPTSGAARKKETKGKGLVNKTPRWPLHGWRSRWPPRRSAPRLCFENPIWTVLDRRTFCIFLCTCVSRKSVLLVSVNKYLILGAGFAGQCLGSSGFLKN